MLRRMLVRLLIALAMLVLLAVAGLWVLGTGLLVEPWGPGSPTASRIPDAVVAERTTLQQAAAVSADVTDPSQILFGDLHVHTTYSTDAFLMSLPMTGGDGAHPVGDACDFARFCSALDFWSINDHAITLTPRRWSETIEGMRQCDATAGDPANPDVVPFLGWEWTQIGTNQGNHYGHKNVVLQHLDDERIPVRPIAAGPPPGSEPVTSGGPGTFGLGLLALFGRGEGGMQAARYMHDLLSVPDCPAGVPVRELPEDCRELAPTPEDLFAKLDDWGHDSLVIPHGTTWGFYSPLGSSWDKQLTRAQHDPDRQTLVEVFSGHGNSEQYRGWREVLLGADGARSCPEASESYEPGCRRAGEIIRQRCLDAGESAEECDERAATARQHYVDADAAGWRTVPGSTVADWLDSGQCRDCFQPAFGYRPRSSVQYMLALSRPGSRADPFRFRFGFIASSDNHSARPGTGYKEIARSEFTEARFANFNKTVLGAGASEREPEPFSEPFDREGSRLPIFAMFESERQGSFFLNGGLVAAHADGRRRDAIWRAFERKEVYGTSGPRILLWFDLVGAGGTGKLARFPMGSEVRLRGFPTFEVRAVGSFEPLPGCPDFVRSALSPERLGRLCRDECYHPSDQRRAIARVEVVRVRPQRSETDDVSLGIEDPWRVFHCQPDPSGCRVTFSDDGFSRDRRDTVYYVRAIEAPSLAVATDPLRCERDATGSCIAVRPCNDLPDDDDCLSRTEERAWSCPIFVDFETER
jgi:hypothetical protein